MRGRLAVCEDSFRTVTIAVNQGSAAAILRKDEVSPDVVRGILVRASLL